MDTEPKENSSIPYSGDMVRRETSFLSILWVLFGSIGAVAFLVFVWERFKAQRMQREAEMETALEDAIRRKAEWEVAVERRKRALLLQHSDVSIPRIKEPILTLSSEGLSTVNESVERLLCVVCQEREKNTVLEPCRHLCLCENCTESLLHTLENNNKFVCPLCRSPVEATFRVHI